ncbi:MAG: TolC family protein [Gammaproteobacteria bacterium]|nr:TolC family protein [Gammaproteobacteria bacterium]MBU2121170.1 TolC family protein [Gammaproteobacteria bacterium]MBU2170194.1 TolC family protein [Gammaproteobacteria bacterium]MBU2202755.1 TolC family protein [Gammaproteobacteria bacterium]MBU2276494.1 TolC family protein [Gammaproteobacteria bacterium]
MAAVALGWALASGAALPQTPARAPAEQPLTLKALFEHAWARQPEAQSATLRREAAQAARNGASSWTAEPVALELSTKTDRPGSNQGNREYEVGVAMPLWLPGERARKAALGDAEMRAVDSRRVVAQLQLAGTVREAWWALQRAQTEHGLAQDRLLNARRLAADVARRVRAGDMARADQFQADGAVAQAEAALAEATGARDVAQAALVAWGGNRPLADAAEPEAEALPAAGLPADHPAVADWQDQAEVARRAADLAAVQTRANPELTVAATRAREQSGERYLQSLTVGVRVPLGGGDRSRAKELAARADALDAELRAGVERNRLAAEVAAASARVRATQAQREAVARHAALARDTRGFIDKAFRLGEADLPTRLRVELDAVQAERQLALARIDAAAAVSTLRQALGLLPQ